MGKADLFTEIVFSGAEPERTLKIADECLLEIRVVESRKQGTAWIYEYEVRGEAGRIAKFRSRLKLVEPER